MSASCYLLAVFMGEKDIKRREQGRGSGPMGRRGEWLSRRQEGSGGVGAMVVFRRHP